MSENIGIKHLSNSSQRDLSWKQSIHTTVVDEHYMYFRKRMNSFLYIYVIYTGLEWSINYYYYYCYYYYYYYYYYSYYYYYNYYYYYYYYLYYYVGITTFVLICITF